MRKRTSLYQISLRMMVVGILVVATVGCGLLSAAPMSEPTPTPTKTILPTLTPAPPTQTVVQPTDTPITEEVAVVEPTEVPTVEPTGTDMPSDTPIPTAPPPTNTPIPTEPPPTATSTTEPTATALPPTDTPVPPPTDTPLPPPPPPTEPPPPPTEPPAPQNQAWDSRIPPEIQLHPHNAQEGDMYWKLVRAVVEDGSTPRTIPGDHHIYVELIRYDGTPVIGASVLFFWNNTGHGEVYRAPGHSISFVMSGGLGSYTVRIGGERAIEGVENPIGGFHPGLSDAVVGLGNAEGKQYSYFLTFQQTVHSPIAMEPPAPDWEPNLPPQVKLYPAQVESGQAYWKIARVDFEDYDQPHNVGGDHQIYVMTIDENGQPVPMGAHFRGGGIDEVMDHLDMYGSVGSYSAQIPGEPSDVVAGMGMRGNYHVSYVLTFHRVIRQ